MNFWNGQKNSQRLLLHFRQQQLSCNIFQADGKKKACQGVVSIPDDTMGNFELAKGVIEINFLQILLVFNRTGILNVFKCQHLVYGSRIFMNYPYQSNILILNIFRILNIFYRLGHELLKFLVNCDATGSKMRI